MATLIIWSQANGVDVRACVKMLICIFTLLQDRMTAVRHSSCPYTVAYPVNQGTALGVIFEPILCCRLFLSTHDAISGGQNIATTAALATTRPTDIEMNGRRPQLDSLGYPKIFSGALL
jgi:hypothetical protein